MLCKSCGSQCRDAPDELNSIEIECVVCDGLDTDCQACGGGGRFAVDRCPREFVGGEVTDAINLISHAEKGNFPVAGGTLDQSAWFMGVMDRLQSDQSKIDAERMERMRRG